MTTLYKELLLLYSQNPFRPKSVSVRFFLQLVHEILIFGQNSQFFWFTSINIQGWDSTKSFWEIINLASFDYFSFKFQFFNQFLIFVLFIYLLFICSIIYLIRESYCERSVKNWIYFLIQSLMYLISDLLFIPILLTILLVFKYSGKEDSVVSEYSLSQSSNGVVFGEVGKYCSIIFILLHLASMVFYEGVSYDCRHIDDSVLSTAKITAKSEVIWKALMIFNCYAFFYFQKENYEIYLNIVIIVYLGNALYILIQLPYYCQYRALFKIMQNIDCGYAAIAFFIGYKINSAPFIVTVFCLLQPALIILTYNFILYRYSKLSSFTLQSVPRSFNSFERSIRSELNDPEGKVSTLLELSNHYKQTKEAYNLILQAYYSLDNLRNPSLANSKISTIKLSSFDLFSNIQIYKCRFICEKAAETCLVNRTHREFIDFSKAKELDKEFCFLFIKFLDAIVRKDCKIEIIKKITTKLANMKGKLMSKFGKLVDRFVDPCELDEIYGNLLCDLLGEEEIGKPLLDQVSTIKTEKKITIGNNNNEDKCYFVVSANEKDSGKILYFTKKFGNLLEISIDKIENLSFYDMMPESIKKQHKSSIKKYLENYSSTNIKDCQGNFILNSKGFAIECSFDIEVVGYEFSLNLFCGLTPTSHKFEFVIIDKYGLIIANSKEVNKILQHPSRYLENLHIDCIFEVPIFELINSGKILSYKIKDTNTDVYILLKSTNLIHSIVYFSESFMELSNIDCNSRDKAYNFFVEEQNDVNKLKKYKSSQKYKNIEKKDDYAFRLHDEKHIFDNDMQENKNDIIDKDRLSSHSSSKNSLSKKEHQSLINSVKALRISKYLISLSVKNK